MEGPRAARTFSVGGLTGLEDAATLRGKARLDEKNVLLRFGTEVVGF